MSVLLSESELRIACDRAGRTCKTEMGCTCGAANQVQDTHWVQGPTDFGAADNPFNEPEQSMVPPTWLARLLLALVAILAIGSAFIPVIFRSKS